MQHVTLTHDGTFHFSLHLFLIAFSSWGDWWAVPLLPLSTKDAVMADEIFVNSGVKFSCFVFNPSKV